MHEMNDDKIKKIMQENVKKPEIKRSAAQILAMHEERKRAAEKPKRIPFFKRPTFKYSLGFLSAALVIGITVYALRDTIIPPIITSETSEITSGDISSPSIPTSEYVPDKIPHGKEGEFVFMTSSALNYAPEGSIPGGMGLIRPSYSISLTDPEKAELEAALDETLPLVGDFFSLDKGFNYGKNKGSYGGKYGTYTHEFIINEDTRIIGNIEIDEDDTETETELEGEIVIRDTYFHFEGETEIDTADNETDISLKIEYDEDSYLEIQSENEADKQTFKYKLYLAGDEKLNVEIKSYNRSGNGNGGRCAEVKTKYNNVDYEFYITKRSGNYVIIYLDIIIIATETEDNKFTYSYE